MNKNKITYWLPFWFTYLSTFVPVIFISDYNYGFVFILYCCSIIASIAAGKTFERIVIYGRNPQ